MLDGRFRFDNFVVGASNRLAASAVRAVADAPGTVYNPLVIYSASGLGKTHLLAALGHSIRESHRELAVEYVTLEHVVSELHDAVASGHAEGLIKRYQRVDILLLDDVQFLTGRAETQSEVLRLLNALQTSGRQIVMTCDRPPNEISDVDQRLLTRMSGGLLVDIGAPEYETRVAILRKKSSERGLTLPPAVVDELAGASIGSVRELEGALNRALAQQSIGGTPPPSSNGVPAVSRQEAAPPDEFASFMEEVEATLSQSVERWRVRLGESIARWAAEGFIVASLERALAAPDAPDIEALEAGFAADVTRLKSLEAEAGRLDAKLARLEPFRDPERLAEAESIVHRALATYEPLPAPRAELTIDTFVIGERNQLALRGASEVIAIPAARYNPLYLHGAAGAGKTHLAHAIGNALAARGGSAGVACVSGAVFTDGLIAAIQDGVLERWRMRYRAVDVLIIDDAQLLAGKERSQEELFHLFNVLQQSGKQIVVTADVPPSQLLDMVPRLRSRFDGGLVVEVGRVPEAERVARHTPVPDGAEAAAPTIDAWFEESIEPTPATFISLSASSGEADTFFLDPEKCVVEWPDTDGRIVEDPR